MTFPSSRPEIQAVPDDGHDDYFYDDVAPTDLSAAMGPVNPAKPLAGLEHIAVLDRDVAILSQAGGPVRDLAWPEVQQVVAKMELFRFQRRPHDLRNYLRWKHATELAFGETDAGSGARVSGVLLYILKVRLEGRWGTDLPIYNSAAGRTLLEDVAQDACILSNDFPYAIDPSIVHVVVWLRTPVPVEPVPDRDENSPKTLAATTQLTHKSNTLINRYVEVNFVDGLGLSPDRVLWFKNWAALQSIPAMEHFHVMLRDPPLEKLKALYSTGGQQIDIYNLE